MTKKTHFNVLYWIIFEIWGDGFNLALLKDSKFADSRIFLFFLNVKWKSMK